MKNRSDCEANRREVEFDRSVARCRDKMDPQAVLTAFESNVRSTVRHFDHKKPAQMLVNEVATSMLDAIKVPPITRLFYLAYAREVYGRWLRWSAKTLENELDIVLARWVGRGMEPSVLQVLEQAVFLAPDESGLPKSVE